MKKEYSYALTLLIVGAAVIGGLYYKKSMQKASQAALDSSDKKIILPSKSANIKEVQEYLEDLQKVYKSGGSVLPLDSSEIDSNGAVAQEIALKDSNFLSDTRVKGEPIHNDIMRVLPSMPSLLDNKSKEQCKADNCYILEKYNFVYNSTTRAIVDIDAKKVIAIKRFDGMQPDISSRLTKVAKAIALKSPEILKELGHTPTPNELSMANVRTNLQESPCEEKHHLCVAPTFADHQKERALWAIVDLTELKLAAAKWAGLGKTYTPACIDERTLQNRYIVKNFCQKDNNISKNGWQITYHLTGSDGLELRNVKYNGQEVAKSLKIVDWHVAYRGLGADKLDTSTPTIVEGRRVEFVKGENNEYTFGYNDAMGCPMFSTSVVLAFNGPQIKPLIENGKEVGFYIVQDFRNPKWPMACNYRYENKFEFYNDGSFRVVAINLGRGCSNKAIYRPVMRLDTTTGTKEQFAIYQDGAWSSWKSEGEYRSTSKEALYKGQYLYRLNSQDEEQKGFYVEPNRGQFKDKSRGDHEHIFVTKYRANEGDEDLLTLGSCCKLDRDGVEPFSEDKESIVGQNLVFWYVPRIQNDDREGHEYCWADSTIDANGNPSVNIWPCIVGPKFVPIKNVEK
ncbi:MAG TPA: hypothetical protein ENK74_06455 [Nitratifractor sp.]|nr:hypothetical protein [Nitratifractor sp.]